jgi:pteridine reductase
VIATELAERGYAIALHYRSSTEEAQHTVEALRARGVACEAFRADVGVQEDVDAMFASVAERFGRLDVLVTTASIWETIALETVTADDMLRHFAANTLGTFLCARRAGLMMVAQEQGGVIVTVGDWAIERPYLDHSAYFVSKGAIPALTRVLAVELAARNPQVRVNCIHPGPVMFPPDSSPEERQEMVESTLVKIANRPESVAHAVQFFVDNPFVTGVCLPVDGGRTVFAQEATSRGRPI